MLLSTRILTPILTTRHSPHALHSYPSILPHFFCTEKNTTSQNITEYLTLLNNPNLGLSHHLAFSHTNQDKQTQKRKRSLFLRIKKTPTLAQSLVQTHTKTHGVLQTTIWMERNFSTDEFISFIQQASHNKCKKKNSLVRTFFHLLPALMQIEEVRKTLLGFVRLKSFEEGLHLLRHFPRSKRIDFVVKVLKEDVFYSIIHDSQTQNDELWRNFELGKTLGHLIKKDRTPMEHISQAFVVLNVEDWVQGKKKEDFVEGLLFGVSAMAHALDVNLIGNKRDMWEIYYPLLNRVNQIAMVERNYSWTRLDLTGYLTFLIAESGFFFFF